LYFAPQDCWAWRERGSVHFSVKFRAAYRKTALRRASASMLKYLDRLLAAVVKPSL
jgi:hypothetical protein